MVYRYSWLVGLTAVLFAFYGLNSLLRPTLSGPPWQLVVLAGFLLGTIITWTSVSYRLNTWIIVGLNLVAMLIAVARIAAPQTTTLFLPTTSTFQTLREEMDIALDLIRNGIEPVQPVVGIVVVVTVVMWVVGGLMAWGLTTGHPYVALVPLLVLSLQFATMDRAGTGWLRAALFVLLVAGTILAITADERDQTAGRMARRGEWPSLRQRLAPAATVLLGVTVLASVGAVSLLEDQVPRDGVLEWRATTGLTGGFTGSGISLNPFIGIQQRLVNQSNEPVFFTRVTGDADGDELYYRLATMETYNGGQFSIESGTPIVTLDDRPWEDPGQAFAGERTPVTVDVQIDQLVMDWLPAPYVPDQVSGGEDFDKVVRARRDDGSIRLEGLRTREGMVYSVDALVPQPDFAALATAPGGDALSVSFRQAEADEVQGLPVPLTADQLDALVRDEPPDVDRYLNLPTDDADARMPEIGRLARNMTSGLETNFEKALKLEAWFHSDDFDYNANIEPGHGATDLAEWLLDPDSPNHREGYCENFSTAMAVMGRTLGIPSRVVLGYTPGEPLPVEPEINPDGNIYAVRGRNAHAWVEMWMPSQGWVRFDPTPRARGNLSDTPQTFETLGNDLGFDPVAYLDVPENTQPVIPPGGGALPDRLPELDVPRFVGAGGDLATDGGGLSVPTWLWAIIIGLGLIAALLAIVPIVKYTRHRRRMHRLEHGDITAAWEDIVDRLTDLGSGPRPDATPAEYAEDIDTAMKPLANVYARAVYGTEDAVNTDHVETAARSLENTSERLVLRYTRTQRIRARFRLRTILPHRLKRKKNR